MHNAYTDVLWIIPGRRGGVSGTCTVVLWWYTDGVMLAQE